MSGQWNGFVTQFSRRAWNWTLRSCVVLQTVYSFIYTFKRWPSMLPWERVVVFDHQTNMNASIFANIPVWDFSCRSGHPGSFRREGPDLLRNTRNGHWIYWGYKWRRSRLYQQVIEFFCCQKIIWGTSEPTKFFKKYNKRNKKDSEMIKMIKLNFKGLFRPVVFIGDVPIWLCICSI